MARDGMRLRFPLMPPNDSRQVIWQNLSALMEHHWGAENLTRLAKTAGVGPATCTRLKEQQTSVGVEIVEKMAAAFQLSPWQLLVPKLDPRLPPALLPSSAEDRALFERVLEAARLIRS